MPTAVFVGPRRSPATKTLYDVGRRIGAILEVFDASDTFDRAFSACHGWYWPRRRGGSADIPGGPSLLSVQFVATSRCADSAARTRRTPVAISKEVAFSFAVLPQCFHGAAAWKQPKRYAEKWISFQ